jgi:hypothetical protein
MTAGPTDAAGTGGRAAARALLVGLAVTLAQLAGVLAAGGGFAAYRSLFHADGRWYKSIAERGYYVPPEPSVEDPGNVAFFPAYPLLAGAVARVSRLPTEIALLLTAQAACAGFWAYFLLFGREHGLSAPALATGVVLTAAHPAAFILLASYSESLFLCALLGFVFWSGRPGAASAALAAVHGFVMTATRLVGAPLVVYPLAAAWLRPGGRGLRDAAAALPVSLVAALGTLSYFAFCRARFGRWNVFFEVEWAGWQVQPDYWAVFYPRAYLLWALGLLHGESDVNTGGQVAALVLLLLLLGLAAWEWRRARRGDGGWRQRAPLWLGALLLFYVPLAGHYTRFLGSYLRFSLCPYVLLVLHGLLLARGATPPWPARVALAAAAATLLAAQAWAAYFVTHGGWIG